MRPRLQGIFALLFVTLVWGTTFAAMKQLGDYFSPTWIICIRFCMAALLLSPFLWRATRADWFAGIALGVMVYTCYTLQIEGLALQSANRNAFITGLNVLLVPVLGLMLGKLPQRRIVVAILMAILGLVALCWDGGAWSRGDTLTLGGALAFALYVMMLDRFSRQASAPLRLTAVQLLTVAACAGGWLAAVELPHGAPLALGAGGYLEFVRVGFERHFYNLTFLGVVATAGVISLQVWGQRHTSANEAAVIYALEPAWAALAAYVWIGETMSSRALFGAVLLIGGMIVSQWQRRPKPPLHGAPVGAALD